jgi:hypothetical protein
MKKILYITFIAVLALTFGCEEPDEVQYTVGPGFHASPGTFTILDNNVTLTLTAENPDVTEMTLQHAGTVNTDGNLITEPQGEIGTVSISEGSGSIELSRSDLGLLQNSSDSLLDHSAILEVTSNIEGNPTNEISISMSDPLAELMGPYVWTTDDDGNPVTEETTVYHNDDEQYIKYQYVRNGGSVDGVTVEEKVNSGGSFSELNVSLNTSANEDGVIVDSVSVVGTDYSVGDTVWHRFTVTRGSYSTSHKTQFVVNKLSFGNTGSFKLDTTTALAYNLVDNKIVLDTIDTALDSADISLWYNGTSSIGFQSPNSNNHAQFVESTQEVWENNNKEEVMAAFNNGSPTSQVTNVQKDEVYIYRTYRNFGEASEEEYYGILKIDEAILTPSLDNYLQISYKN